MPSKSAQKKKDVVPVEGHAEDVAVEETSDVEEKEENKNDDVMERMRPNPIRKPSPGGVIDQTPGKAQELLQLYMLRDERGSALAKVFE